MVEEALDRNRVAVGVMLALTLVGVAIVATRNLDVETPQEIEGELTVRIGVVSPKQENDPEYRFLARLAEREINAYCEESGIDYRFEFVFGCADGMASPRTPSTRFLQTALRRGHPDLDEEKINSLIEETRPEPTVPRHQISFGVSCPVCDTWKPQSSMKRTITELEKKDPELAALVKERLLQQGLTV